jgi:hypothetical protein
LTGEEHGEDGDRDPDREVELTAAIPPGGPGAGLRSSEPPVL